MLRLAGMLEAVVFAIGRVAAWLTVFMVVVTVIVVVMRYFFDAGFIWMQELVTWAHAAVFLIGAAYTFAHDDHVRVDVFYRRATPAVRAVVNIVGTVLLLWPVCIWLGLAASRYAIKSWVIAERSAETGGLGYPMVPLAKTLLAAMLLLLVIQGLVIVLRNVHALRSGNYATDNAPEQAL